MAKELEEIGFPFLSTRRVPPIPTRRDDTTGADGCARRIGKVWNTNYFVKTIAHVTSLAIEPLVPEGRATAHMHK